MAQRAPAFGPAGGSRSPDRPDSLRKEGTSWYDRHMIVCNTTHETAIVIKRDGQIAVLVRLKAGKLKGERIPESRFRCDWHESHYPLAETVERFLAHAAAHGATQEALKGLEKIQAHERYAVGNLF